MTIPTEIEWFTNRMSTTAPDPIKVTSLPGEETTQMSTTSRPAAALAGVLGAALSLSIGELAAARSNSIISLVKAIGEIVIDITPGSLIADSINTLGSSQRPMLLGGITIVALLIGGFIGVRGAEKPSAVPVGFGIFGIVGGLAGARSDLTSAGGAWFVALLAAVGGAALTLVLLRFCSRRATAPATTSAGNEAQATQVITPGAPLTQMAGRRGFIAFSAAAAGTAAVYGASRLDRTNIAEAAREDIISGGSNGGGATASPAIFEPTVGGFDSVPGISPYITPINPEDEFYLIDTALTKPQVNIDTWTFDIGGEVTTPLTFTYDDLMARDHIEREVTLSCVSYPVGGNLVDNAHWTGIELSELLDEAGVDPTDPSTQVFMRSVDGFTCGFPTTLAYDGRTAMLALLMNGEPLPVKHGFPARIVVAGLYGYVSATKWIESITINQYAEADGFWIPRGWSKEGPIKTQSRIDVPLHRERLLTGPVAIGGIAWSPTIGIDRVEVSISPEETFEETLEQNWVDAELAPVDNDETWVQWKYDWAATPGRQVIAVRATDKNGGTQSSISVPPAPNGAEGYHAIQVTIS